MTIRRQKTVQAAEKLVQKGRLEAAIGEYRKVLNDAPNDTRTLNRVGDLYLRLGRLDEAVDLFGRAASHFSREGFYVKAIAIYKKVIRVDPTRIEIYEALADLYRQQGLLNEARAQYQVVADYHAQSGDTLAVISIQRKIVELDPQDPAARLALADLCLQADRRPEAVAQYLEIAELMVEHERYGEAVRFYGRALDLDPSDLSFLTDAVLELKDRGQAVVAEELLAKAEEVNPEASRVRRMTGLKDASEAAAPAEVPEPEPEAQKPPPAEPPSEEESAVQVVDLTEEAPPAAAAEEPAERKIDLAEALEFEIGLDELEVAEEGEPELLAAGGEEEEAADIAREAEEFLRSRADPAMGEEAERSAELAERALEMMAEAQVLATYGLDSKAAERFEHVLQIQPENLEAYRRLIELHVQEARREEVADTYARARAAVPQEAEPARWRRIHDLLTQEGYQLTGETLAAPAEEPPAEEPPTEEPLAVEPPVAEPPPEEPLAEEPQAEEPPAAAEPEPVEKLSEESRVTWLDRLGGSEAKTARDRKELFGEEQEFFDLAAELEHELEQEEKRLGEEVAPPSGEQSLEEIVKGFKKGVSETLSEQDYDTHYNLGIAYREMGLLDEAIGEFQLAAKNPRYLVDCCSLLGASFLEKGFGDLAVKWYRRGLESSEINEEERLGLLYELGNLHLLLEEREAAREVFVEIYGVNSNYRDVVAKLEELRAS